MTICVALGDRIISCLPPPYSPQSFSIALDLATSLPYDIVHAEQLDDQTPMKPEFVLGRNNCLAKHHLTPASGALRKDSGLAGAKLKLTNEEFTAWVKHEIETWKPIVGYEKSRNTLSDWPETPN
jgi:hypothetical protein